MKRKNNPNNNYKAAQRLLSANLCGCVLHIYIFMTVICTALRELLSAANVSPSPHLLPSRQTRPACCPPFSTSIISMPAGWVGRSAIGGCSSPRRWNSLRPSTIASEAEQPPVWADCGGRSRETGRLPNQLLPPHSLWNLAVSLLLYLYSLYIARDVERLQNIYYCMYVDKSRF